MRLVKLYVLNLFLLIPFLHCRAENVCNADNTDTAITQSTDISRLFAKINAKLYNNPEKALELSFEALEKSQEQQLPKANLQSMLLIAQCYKVAGSISKAYEYSSKVSTLAKINNYPYLRFEALKQLTEINNYFRNYHISHNILQQAEILADSLKDENLTMICLILKCNIYLSSDLKHETNYYFNLLRQKLYNNDDSLIIADAWVEMAGWYNIEGKSKLSALTYRNAIAIYKNLGMNYQMSRAMSLLSKVLLHVNEFKTSISYAREAIELSIRFHDYENLSIAYENLATCYSNKKDYKNAFINLNFQQQYSDSLHNKEKSIEILELKKMFSIQKLEDVNRRQKNDIKTHKKSSQNRLTTNYVLSICLTGVFVILIFLSLKLYNYKKVNKAITAQNIKTENQIRFFELFIEKFPYPLYYKHRTSKMTGCNKAFEQLIGMNKVDILEQSEKELLPDHLYEKLLFHENKLKDENDIVTFEFTLRLTDGKKHNYIITKELFYFGEYQVITTLLFDISNLKVNEKALVEANRTKNLMFSILGHDLLNPVGNLKNLIGLIKKSADNFTDKNLQHLIKLAHVSSNQAFNLLENILSWAKSQKGEIIYDPIHLSLHMLVESIIELYAAIAQDKNINLESSVNQHIFVYADRNLLHTVIRNLISNALKFTPEGGKVSVKALVKFDYVEIAISDTGVGIDKKLVENIFQKNQMISNYGTKNEKGSGLGLMICKGFVLKNGGKLWIESEEDIGTTVKFTIPKSNEFFNER